MKRQVLHNLKLHFFIWWTSCCLYLFDLGFYEEVAEVAWTAVCNEGFFVCLFLGNISLHRLEDWSIGKCLVLILLKLGAIQDCREWIF